jgi:hypothetical protein
MFWKSSFLRPAIHDPPNTRIDTTTITPIRTTPTMSPSMM